MLKSVNMWYIILTIESVPGDVDGVGLCAGPEEDARDWVHGQVERAEEVLSGARALQCAKIRFTQTFWWQKESKNPHVTRVLGYTQFFL